MGWRPSTLVRGSSPTRCRPRRRPRCRPRRRACWRPSARRCRHERAARLRARQLRLVHLESRPASRPHRRRCDRRAQRRGHGGRGRRHGAGCDRHLAGAVKAREGRDQRRARASARSARAAAGRVPRPPGDRRGVWRIGGSRAAGAREGGADPPRAHQRLRRPPLADLRRALPLAGHRASLAPARAGADRLVGRRARHGRAASVAPGRGLPVPPRVDPHRGWRGTDGRVPGPHSGDGMNGREQPMRPAVAAAVELVAGGGTPPAPPAEAAMEELMDGSAPPVQVAALLAMMRLRGETPEEVAAFARVMRGRAVRVEAPADAVDLCGTGADGLHTFNISTLASFVVAGAGAPVAKHGNRAITSRSGSADLIEALGIPLDPGPEAVAASIRETNFGFMFAPAYHPAMKHAMPIRRELPMRTIFNLLGPLSSPARVRRQLLGVADPSLVPLIAGALSRLEAVRALVVHGADGSDELSLAGPNHAVLGGEPGPARDVVLLNAGAALFVAGRASDVGEGIAQAAEAIDSGRAADVVTAAARVSAA